jgi:hypothetical protein
LATAAEGFSNKPTGRGPERLCSELQSSWNVLADLTASLFEASSPLRITSSAPASLRETREQYAANTSILLVELVEQFVRLRPIHKSLEAMREFDRATGASAARARASIDSRFQAVLADAALNLCEPWRIWRSGGREDEWNNWDQRRTALAKQASDLLEKYSRWTPNSGGSAAGGGEDARSEKRRETWWRQQRAVVALLEMELSIRDLGLVWLQGVEDLVETLRLERQGILSVTEKMVVWIEQGAGAGTAAPIEELELATYDERLRVWTHLLEEEAQKRFADRLELVQPGTRPAWRSLRARETFLTAFANSSQGPVRRAVEQYWEQSATLVREGGRSREIINYWRVAAASRGDAEALFAEARHNATTVLRDQLHIPATEKDLESKLVDAFQVWMEEGSTALEAAQSGWIALFRQPRGRQVLRRVVRSGVPTARKALLRGGRWTADRWDRILESVGGKLPAHPAAEPVIRRATLRDILALPASKSDLPAIYGLLFRIAPVEDRRFLVGRDRELAGLDQALKDWDSGRFAACLFVGARGSGKTSLLNCAANSAFSGREVIRTQFVERALNRELIDDFLRQLLGLDVHADLAKAFAAERRILMIEESERIYLRKVGGFEGANHLLRWIHSTASTTLWVIVMNDRAFRVLDAGVQFGSAFSHRINAMSVSREDLENAILERHRLSGLRLEFASPPAGDPRVNRVKKWIGWQDSPQKLFFDSLYQQSGGVFRSAFELWLSSIEQVQGETLKIRQPLEPAFSRFRRELAQEDQFTLLAIQEHGSLTQREVADVLCAEEDMSRSRLDRLAALGLIEQDPEHPGFRVRPEAQRFANDLLRRVNLA